MTINGVTEGSAQDGSTANGEAAWASTSGGNATAVGSDEALGGALLTPIPWLARRATNGDGGSESGESSTLGSEGGPAPLAANPGAVATQQRSAQGRQYEMQVRTESTETIEGPNGMGSIETVTVSVNGLAPLSPATQQRVITQGELIRQEQRAGVVPVSQLARTGSIVVTSSEPELTAADGETSDAAMAEGEHEGESEESKDVTSEKSDEDMADEDELPHARGPDIIGAADMGPQTPSSSTFSISSGGNVEVRGIDVEAAVGRKHEAIATTSSATAQSESSDEGDMMTPASSEAEGATITEQTETGNGHDQKFKDHEAEKDSESNDEEATSAALSSPIHGKREAEDDIMDTESVSSKRQKATSNDSEFAKEVSSANLAEKANPEPEPSTEEQPKDDEGDIVIADETAPAPGAEPAPAVEDTGTAAAEPEEEKEEKAVEEGKARPAESTD